MQTATGLAHASFLVRLACIFKNNVVWNKGYNSVQSGAALVVPFDLPRVRIHEINAR